MAIFQRDVFDVIKEDHRGIMELFDQLEKTDEVTVNRRPQLLRQLQDELLPHMAAEETTFYPLMENGELAHHTHLRAEEEHLAARHVLDDLLAMDCCDERFLARLGVLRTLIRLHVVEEEKGIFPLVRSKITNEDTIRLIDVFQNAKNRFRQQAGVQRRAA